jgi:hypothetical protein
MDKKAEVIFKITSDIHDKVTEIYEALTDGLVNNNNTEINEGILLILQCREQLLDLKNNIIQKDTYEI